MGTTWAQPPPAAPPLIPNTGPREGSRRQRTGLASDVAQALPSAPTEVVVLPSPALVGVIPATQTSLPSGGGEPVDRASEIFALCRP